jgi:hypothetical protein
MSTWTSRNPVWAQLNPYQRAAAMALMEADGANAADARNALGAMVNRAKRSNEDLGQHVSKPIYQPTIEPAQERRLSRILSSPAYQELTGWAERRWSGQEPDPVQGATHFLAPERTMVALTAREPNKYRSWPRWTGYNPETGSYKNVVLRDGSHAFVAPEGAFSAPGEAGRTNIAMNGSISGGERPAPMTTAGATPASDPDNGGAIEAIVNSVFPTGDKTTSPTGGGLFGSLGGVKIAGNDDTTQAAQQAQQAAASPHFQHTPLDPARLREVIARRPTLGFRSA